MKKIMHYRSPTTIEIEKYNNSGFLVVNNVIVQEDVKTLKKICDIVIENKEKFAVRDWAWAKKDGKLDERKFKIIQTTISDKFEEIGQMSFRKWSIHFASELLGEPVKFWYDQFLAKSPGFNAPTPWHQDEAYWGPTLNNQGITCWMPFQDVNTNNGCMHFIKNGHKKGILKHTNPEQMQSDQLICDIEDSVIISCPIQVGSITFHHSKMPHMTTANKTDKMRYALSQHFHTESAKIDTKQQYNWKVIRTQIKDETTESQ